MAIKNFDNKTGRLIRKYIDDGLSVQEIMNVTGLKMGTVYAYSKGHHFTDFEKHNDIAELRRQGKSIFEIREITGKDAKIISDKCRDIGLRITEEEIKETRRRDSERKAHDEDYVRNYVHEKSEGRFEYVSGYINMDSSATLRCTRCGKEQERPFSGLRKMKGRMLCRYCEKPSYILSEEEKERRAEEQEHKRIEREKKKFEAERRRYINASGNQMSFNVCEGCGMLIGNKFKWCDACSKKRQNKYKEITRRVKIKNALVDSDITIDKLLRRDGYVCHICGKLCDKNDYIQTEKAFIAGNYYPSIDHVIPLAKGGLHSWDNVKIAHRICNSYKGDDYDEDEVEKPNNQSYGESWNISAVV